MKNKVYACIDLKSFYASVECVERGLDPLTTNLVVADGSRTEKTVCLAISPSMKQYGLNGRARLFEVVQKVREVNADRRYKNYRKPFKGKSYNDLELKKDRSLELDYITAVPRMSHYMKYSTKIYDIYLRYVSPDDIYVYSIDEVFCDITNYLSINKLTPRELVTKMIHDVYEETGITATAGIGTNMYLAKIAMDIVAKHSGADKFGVRMAELDEMSYRKKLWSHRPITDFWRVGKGYAKRLESRGMFTMGDIARCSIKNEELLYKMFGINAELLIDHAWGWEPCTMDKVKEFKPLRNSISTGQVLHCAYNYEKTKLIIKEMSDLLALDLVAKKLVTDQIVLTVGYDIDNLTIPYIKEKYYGEVTVDHYGRKVPKHAHGTINIDHKTSSSKTIVEKTVELFDRIINKDLLIRRINITANNVVNELLVKEDDTFEQYDLFTDYKLKEEMKKKQKEDEEKEHSLQNTILNIKNRFGKNAVLKGMNFEEGGTTIERNNQIGGHKS